MAINPRLELRQGQTLTMTPQLQQAIKLLQMSNLELAEFVEAEIEKNPLLERDDSLASERPDLPADLADSMCAWVSDALKSYIQTNYHMAPRRVDAALSEATIVVKSEPAGPKDPPADSAQKLIEKLAASGQLKAGFLMRVLSQGQIDLFDLAFARLLNVELNRFRIFFYDDGVRLVALACRAAGIDRSAFPTVFNLSRQARGGHALIQPGETSGTENLFALTRAAALAEIRAHL